MRTRACAREEQVRRSAGGYVPLRRVLPIDTPFSVSFFHTAQVVDSTSEVVLRSSEVDPTTSEFFERENACGRGYRDVFSSHSSEVQ